MWNCTQYIRPTFYEKFRMQTVASGSSCRNAVSSVVWNYGVFLAGKTCLRILLFSWSEEKARVASRYRPVYSFAGAQICICIYLQVFLSLIIHNSPLIRESIVWFQPNREEFVTHLVSKGHSNTPSSALSFPPLRQTGS